MEQRFSFDGVAEKYDRLRPGYPEPLVSDVVRLSGISPDDRILEVGAGTGQASVPFAGRGYEMVCLEPGPNMARIARRNLSEFGKATVVSETFEDWPLEEESFALIISAQAFHWVAPEIRFVKAAAALHRFGALALFGHSTGFDDTPIREDLEAVYARYAPSMGEKLRGTRWYGEGAVIPGLFAESGCFGEVAVRRYPVEMTYTAADYVDRLDTSSDHRLLPGRQRKDLLSAVHGIVERHGGTIRIGGEAHLYLAHRRDQGGGDHRRVRR